MKKAKSPTTPVASQNTIISVISWESLVLSLEKLEKENPEEDSIVSDDAVYYGKTPKDISENHGTYLYGDEI